MTCLKAVVVGVVTGLLAVVMWVAGSVLLSDVSFMAVSDSGSGGIGSVSAGFADVGLLLAVLVGFIVGFAWTIKRSRQQQSAFS